MKKVLILALLLVALVGCAQTKVLVGKTITLAWDAPALGGIPLSEVSYEVYLQPYPTGTSTLVGTVTALEQVVTFAVEGRYKIGVRTKRTTADGTLLYSSYSWSDVDGTPSPWYVVYYENPARVERVRIK